MDYEEIDRSMMIELWKEGMWLCPICGATRKPTEWRGFSSQMEPKEPCKLCGCRLIHGIISRSKNTSGRVFPWYPRSDELAENGPQEVEEK